MSAPQSTPKKPGDYRVAIICAIDFEMRAAYAMLDREHPDLRPAPGDPNLYVLGEIGGHNVALACLAGTQGKGAAATVATNMARTFPSIKWRFLVGIGGGVPSRKHGIRLGDVVVSMPEGEYGGVVQYDLGKDTDGGFQLKGFLQPPPTILRNAVVRMGVKLPKSRMARALEDRCRLSDYERPAPEHDVLFKEDYAHVPSDDECRNCDMEMVEARPPRRFEGPDVHYGLIASGDRVMKSVLKRVEATGKIGDVLCFEMEAAGIATDFPCLVIRGISDYADSHKNDHWQEYAAAVAAAYTRQLISSVTPEQPEDYEVPAPSNQRALDRSDPVSQNLSGRGVQNTGNFSVGGNVSFGVLPDKTEEAISEAYLAALSGTNPRDDKERILQTKGGLLTASCSWVLENEAFTVWREDPLARLLWVKGNPGKGKTMILCGIIHELEQSTPTGGPLSYFFCQGTDSHINNATAVVRGLIYMLLKHNVSLVSCVREYYDADGKPLFREANSWVALSQLLSNILNNQALKNACLVIDALDECETDLPLLLKFISEHSSESHRVKWIVSSRNRLDIEEQLADSGAKLSLELTENATQVSNAVDTYIDERVSELKSLPDKHKTQVRDTLRRKANGTFLWAALVIKELQTAKRWAILRVVEEVPMDLERLYDRMISQIQQQSGEEPEYCRLALSAVTLALRPPSLAELSVLSGLPDVITEDLDNVRDIVSLCGSFLTIQGDLVYLIHQSVKDYLGGKDGDVANDIVFPSGPADVHRAISSRSLRAMSTLLRRDIYDLKTPGIEIDEIMTPEADPLATIRYSCVHWVDHFCLAYSNARCARKCIADLSDEGPILGFFGQRFLYWMESLSLLRRISDGMRSLTALLTVAQSQYDTDPFLLELLKDAERFAFTHIGIIGRAPLQTYGSALVFTPTESKVRNLYWDKDRLPFIEYAAGTAGSWGAHRQTLEHGGWVEAIALSPDSSILASSFAREDSLFVFLWFTATGVLWKTLKTPLEDHKFDNFLAISPDTKTVILATKSGLAYLWDVTTGKRTWAHDLSYELGDDLDNGYFHRPLIALSPDGKTALFKSRQSDIYICDTETRLLHVGPRLTPNGAAPVFSPDSKIVASASIHGGIHLWDPATCAIYHTLDGASSGVQSLSFSTNTKIIGSASGDHNIHLWDAETGVLQRVLNIPSLGTVNNFIFSPDGTLFAVVSNIKLTISVWDTTGALRQTLKGHTENINALAFSAGGTTLVSAAQDDTVRIWDVTWTLDDNSVCLGNGATGADGQLLGFGQDLNAVALSPNSKTIATASRYGAIQLWDLESNRPPQPLRIDLPTQSLVGCVTFTPDSRRLAAYCSECVFLLDVSTGTLQHAIEPTSPRAGHNSVTFSPDGKTLAATNGNSICLYDVETGTCQQTLQGEGPILASVIGFSPNGATFASNTGYLLLWDVATGELRQVLGLGEYTISGSFSPDSKTIVSLSISGVVHICDVRTGSLIRKIAHTRLGWFPCAETFSPDSKCVFVEAHAGFVRINLSSNSSTYSRASRPAAKIFRTGEWLRTNGADLLWLPPNYRTGVYASGQDIFISRHHDGAVTFLSFDMSTSDARILDA